MSVTSGLVVAGFTVSINLTSAGADETIRVVGAGKRFLVHYLHLESSAGVDLIFKSGATPLSGAIAITGTQVYDFEMSGEPFLKGAAVGDDFIINVSAAADLDGWAYMTEIDI